LNNANGPWNGVCVTWNITTIGLVAAVEMLFCLLSVLLVGFTLSESFAIRRRAILMSKGPSAIRWSMINVRGKGCLLAVTLLGCYMQADRCWLLHHGLDLATPGRFLLFSLLQTLMNIFVAITAVTNMLAFRHLRDAETSA
jgi:hypothetical protein